MPQIMSLLLLQEWSLGDWRDGELDFKILLQNLMTSIQSQEPTWRKRRTDSYKLVLWLFHVCCDAQQPPPQNFSEKKKDCSFVYYVQKF